MDIDGIFELLKSHITDNNRQFASLEAKLDKVINHSQARLSKLERWQSKLLGIWLGITGVGSFLFFLLRWIRR